MTTRRSFLFRMTFHRHLLMACIAHDDCFRMTAGIPHMGLTRDAELTAQTGTPVAVPQKEETSSFAGQVEGDARHLRRSVFSARIDLF